MFTLKDFYKAYADWLRAGAPEINDNRFTRYNGLCSNLTRWCECNQVNNWDTFCMRNKMKSQFIRDGLNERIPFNNRALGMMGYTQESASSLCHLNEQRRKWVFDHE